MLASDLLPEGTPVNSSDRPPRKSGHERLSEDEKRALSRLLEALEMLRVYNPTMPLHQASSFLRVALEEGQGVLDYAKKSGVSLSVMSRHLLDIGQKLRNNDPGLGLIEKTVDPMELRKHQHWLTRKGEKLAHDISNIFNRRH